MQRWRQLLETGLDTNLTDYEMQRVHHCGCGRQGSGPSSSMMMLTVESAEVTFQPVHAFGLRPGLPTDSRR
jgi:hypothetical protein